MRTLFSIIVFAAFICNAETEIVTDPDEIAQDTECATSSSFDWDQAPTNDDAFDSFDNGFDE